MADQHPIVAELAEAERAYTKARQAAAKANQAAAKAKAERDRLRGERNDAILDVDPKTRHTEVACMFGIAEGTVRSIRTKHGRIRSDRRPD